MKSSPCLLACALAAAAARAQETQAPEPPPPAAPAAAAEAPASPEAKPAPAPPPDATRAPAAAEAQPAPAAPDEAVRLAAALADLKGAVDKVARVRFGGFVQGRYEWHEDASPGLKSDGKPAETTQFLVRRARLKATVEAPHGELVLDIDAVPKGVTLKDAQVTLIEPWTPFAVRFTVGQFKIPFSYELLLSDEKSELPERSRAVRALFPGERDRGLRLQGKYGWLRFGAALVNGNGIEDPIYAASDQNVFKDVIARVGAEFGWAAFAFSGYVGENLKTTLAPPSAPDYQRFRRVRFGGDAQLTFEIPALGPLAVRGEFVWANDAHLGAGPGVTSGETPDPAKDVTSFGSYLTVVQRIGTMFGAVLRVDHFETNTQKPGDQVVTAAAGLLADLPGNARVTVAFEVPVNEGTNVPDSAFTAQLQIKF